jgi:hypothetical protein
MALRIVAASLAAILFADPTIALAQTGTTAPKPSNALCSNPTCWSTAKKPAKHHHKKAAAAPAPAASAPVAPAAADTPAK